MFIFSQAFSQEDLKDTSWFDKDWKGVDKTNACFYRVYSKTVKGYLVLDKYSTGETQMIAEASALKPVLIKEGKAIYYFKNGIRQKRGSYLDNKKIGDWIYYFDDEKDSSITRYKEDGTEEKLRKSKHDGIFTIVETNAEFPGGLSAMMKYISVSTKYPENAKRMDIGGKAFLKFVIDEKGLVTNIDVIKGTGLKELDEEAIRVVKAMPKWKPATMTGVPVKCYFNIPFSFGMAEPYHVFNTNNKNEKYVLAWDALLSNNIEKALELYGQDVGDVEAWYNMGVIYFNRKDKIEAKKYFENVKSNITDTKNQFYVLSDKFLTNSF